MTMQCPNCGRYIRSTTQCAHCGHKFTPAEVAEMKKQSEPQTPRSSKGGLSILWNVIKLVIALMLIFLLFLYGPTYASKLMGYFNSSNGDTAQVAKTPAEKEEPKDATENKEMGSDEETADEMNHQLVLKDHKVDTSLYPQVKVQMDFEGAVDGIDAKTFAFEVDNQGNITKLEDYSLQKEGQMITLTYKDPSLSVVASDNLKQTLVVKADQYNLKEQMEYQLPSMTVDESLAAQFNTIMTEDFNSSTSVHAAVRLSDQDLPLVYNDQSVEASELIALFAIAKAYDLNENQGIELDHLVTIDEALIATNDDGEVANRVGEEITLYELFSSAIQHHDATAINHIIQTTGGPNDFNRWLKEKGYFSTKITQQLSLDDNGTIVGSATTAQDVSQLLTDLVDNSLLSQQNSEDYLTLLRSSPTTDKFPAEGLHDLEIVSRSELVTSDTDSNQYYAGVIMTPHDTYVIVLLKEGDQESESSIEQIAHSIQSLVRYFETGATAPEPTPEPEPELEPAPQPEPAPDPTLEPQAAQPAQRPWETNPEEWYRGEDGRWYNKDPNYQYN